MGDFILKHKKVIIWGYKLHSHTHSYIHAGYYKAFKALGYETYWLDSRDSFDTSLFENALIFSEQWAVMRNPNLPLLKSSTYAIHYIGNKNNLPEGNPGANLYLGRVGRLIDIRYNANNWQDKNYNYVLNKNSLIKIGPGSYYESYLAPDVRHKAFLDWGYIPCRNFKNISYGQLGMTNSKPVHEFFDGNIIYNEDTYKLFFDAQKEKENYDLIKSQMLFVKENHTYINRAKELIEAVNY